jgi:alpha-tubulin suppressor-like RCC1 family protein
MKTKDLLFTISLAIFVFALLTANSFAQIIAAGQSHSLFICDDSTVRACGQNQYYGQLGNGTIVNSNTPVQVVGQGGTGYIIGIVSVAAGDIHSLALHKDGTVYAWGNGYAGQLGNNMNGVPAQTTTTPVMVSGPAGVGYLNNVIAIAGGYNFSLALRNDSTVWSWGSNTNGCLGDGTTTERDVPIQVTGPGGLGYLTGITAIAAGQWFCLALKSDGTLWAWGKNTNGTLGNNTTTDSHTPVQVLGPGGTGYLSEIKAISARGPHSIALQKDGKVWTWGWGGTLGNNTNMSSDQLTPIQVQDVGGVGYLSEIYAIAGGMTHCLALKNGGTVYGWGYNQYGQVGNNTFNPWIYTPVQVAGPGGVGYLTGITAIAGPEMGCFSLALKNDGTVWSWGGNSSGQLGNGNNTDTDFPVQVAGLCSMITHADEITEPLSVSVFPDPSTGRFTISSNENISRIEIYNVLGERIYTAGLKQQASGDIDISGSPQGIYFIKSFSGERDHTEIILIQ